MLEQSELTGQRYTVVLWAPLSSFQLLFVYVLPTKDNQINTFYCFFLFPKLFEVLFRHILKLVRWHSFKTKESRYYSFFPMMFHEEQKKHELYKFVIQAYDLELSLQVAPSSPCLPQRGFPYPVPKGWVAKVHHMFWMLHLGGTCVTTGKLSVTKQVEWKDVLREARE